MCEKMNLTLNKYRLFFAVLFLLAGLYFFQMSIFYAWEAGHSLSKNIEPNQTWTFLFLGFSCVSFSSAAFLLWRYLKISKLISKTKDNMDETL